MNIAFTHNLRQRLIEEEAEFDSLETVDAIKDSLTRLGHRVDLVEVGGPPSRTIARLEALNPSLVFNTAEGATGRYREAFFPGMFEQLGLPFTGSDAYVCTITLDKDMTKRLLAAQGVPVPRSKFITRMDDLVSLGLRYPLIVKPNFEGSSKGITELSVVHTAAELRERTAQGLERYAAGVLAEEFIPGRDVSIAFLEGAAPRSKGILPPVGYAFQLAPEKANSSLQIYDYQLKNDNSEQVAPQVLDDLVPETQRRLLAYAQQIFPALGIRDLGRIDFRITPQEDIYFIEANALPSLEPEAGIYLAAEAVGLHGMDAVLNTILASAAKRYGFSLRTGTARSAGAKKLRVGFTYNVKRLIPTADNDTDQEAEFDAPKTIHAISDAIASYGHEVVELEATPELPNLLAVSNVDVVFNVAEGIRGRNREAQIPALLELLNIPHTGSDSATMALTLDKGMAKRIVREEGLRTPAFLLLVTGKERVPAHMNYPMVVKPVAEGSSKGVASRSVVHNEAELRAIAADLIGKYGQAALAEEYLPGREFTVALLGERRPRVLPPMEVKFLNADEKFPIYSFVTKLNVNAQIGYDAPAQIDDRLKNELERMSRKGFYALGCRDVARFDFRLDANGRPHFMECNPLPGLTPGWSDLCLIAEGAGMDYRTLIGEILSPAIRRLREKRKLLLQV
ncbi:MAG: D-alanine--D-alanine ligase [Elusimicrobiota bacterium]